ncbi:MAG: crotonase/enoyl-CoA hydratase family protein [Ghiorsea sp.]
MQYNTNLKVKTNREEGFSSLDITYEENHELAWYRMNAHPRPCFTPEVVSEIQGWFDEIISGKQQLQNDLRYIVMASTVPDVFCLGGDLNLFLQFIRNNDEEALLKYDEACIRAMFLIHTDLGKDITTIALVQGDALGGGFEGVLANDVIIAERSARMGLPDILFNLFPGAGAYSFLSRKIGMVAAERMVLSGKLYTPEELFDLGVVDVLAEDGEGEQAVYEYIKKENRHRNGRRAFKKAKRLHNPVTLDELMAGAKIWADAAMNLGDKDLRMMERLVKRQSSKF